VAWDQVTDPFSPGETPQTHLFSPFLAFSPFPLGDFFPPSLALLFACIVCAWSSFFCYVLSCHGMLCHLSVLPLYP
jgi:hypothetical protein